MYYKQDELLLDMNNLGVWLGSILFNFLHTSRYVSTALCAGIFNNNNNNNNNSSSN